MNVVYLSLIALIGAVSLASYFLMRRKRHAWAWILIAINTAFVLYLFSPECRHIPAPPPDESRNKKDYYLDVYQQADGEWYECKTRITRFLYF